MIAAPLQNAQCLYLAEEDAAKTGSACLGVVDAKNLVALAQDFLAAGYHIEDVCGLVAAEGAVSVYHFDHFDNHCRATVMVVVPFGADGKATFPSIASVYQGAEWHERETRDFFGFVYEGNPNFVPLLLADDMVDVHPLLKDEEARKPLAELFAVTARGSKIVKKADGFPMFDAPVVEEAPAAPVAEAASAKVEAPKEEAKAAPAPEKAEVKKAEPQAESKAAPAPEKKAETKPAAKPETKPEAKAPAKKGDDSTKKTVAASGKKGAKNG